jgi:hypothetical protein
VSINKKRFCTVNREFTDGNSLLLHFLILIWNTLFFLFLFLGARAGLHFVTLLGFGVKGLIRRVDGNRRSAKITRFNNIFDSSLDLGLGIEVRRTGWVGQW